MKIVNITGFISLCVLLFSSCIKEDTSDCVVEIVEESNSRVLFFQTVPYKYNFQEIVESVRLYVYDDDEDKFLKTYRDITVDELMGNEYGVILSEWDEIANEDKYHIIGVLNLNDHYEIHGDQQLTTYETHIIRDEWNETSEDLNDIFIGYIQLDPLTKAVKQDTIILEKLTNRIYLTVEFENFQLPAGTELISHITGSNSEYNYMNNSLEYSTMTYKPYYNKGHEALFYFEIVTGKLYLEDDLELHIGMYNESDRLMDNIIINITDHLAEIQDSSGNYLYNTNQKLQEEDEFEIYVLIGDDFQIISLNVNDWYVIRPGVDL